MASEHSGEKRFSCTNCEGSFATENHMNVHIASVCEGKNPFQCKICDKGLSSKWYLKRNILPQFMRRRSHSNVKVAITDVLKEVI